MGKSEYYNEPELSLDEVFAKEDRTDDVNSNSLGGSWGFASVERKLDLNLSVDLEKQEGRMEKVLRSMGVTVDVNTTKTTAEDDELRRLPQKRLQLTAAVDAMEDELAQTLGGMEKLSEQFEQWRSQAQHQQTQQRRLTRFAIKRGRGVSAFSSDEEDRSTVSSQASSVSSQASSDVTPPPRRKVKTGKKAKQQAYSDEDSSTSDFSEATPPARKLKKGKKATKRVESDDDATSTDLSEATPPPRRKGKKMVRSAEDSAAAPSPKRKLKKGKKVVDSSDESSFVSRDSEATPPQRRRKDKKQVFSDEDSFSSSRSSISEDTPPPRRNGKKGRKRVDSEEDSTSVVSNNSEATPPRRRGKKGAKKAGDAVGGVLKKFKVTLKNRGSSIVLSSSAAAPIKIWKVDGKTKKKEGEVDVADSTLDDTEQTQPLTDEDSLGAHIREDSWDVSFFDWTHWQAKQSPACFDWRNWRDQQVQTKPPRRRQSERPMAQKPKGKKLKDCDGKVKGLARSKTAPVPRRKRASARQRETSPLRQIMEC